jgi:hypothetical protein
MPRRIDKQTDDTAAGIRFHTSSGRLSLEKMSYVAFQRFLDEMERSMYLCPECGWRGRGRDLAAMERDGEDAFDLSHEAESWYACPKCECEIAVDKPILKEAG